VPDHHHGPGTTQHGDVKGDDDGER
jgi:hypothetical protein